jgi:hypothetical protein
VRAGRFVGRVGGLAVALGVGVAVASSPGIACAEDGVRQVLTRPHRRRRLPRTAGAAGAAGAPGSYDSQGNSTTIGTTAGTTGTSTVAGSDTKGALKHTAVWFGGRL